MSKLFCLLMLLGSFSAQAGEVASSEVTIVPSTISEVKHFPVLSEPGSSESRFSIVVAEGGMSTDVYPRYSLYLGFASYAEMGNISTNFELGRFLDITEIKKKAPGIFEVKAVKVTERDMPSVTLTIDATQVLADEENLRKSCDMDFCDKELSSKVKVTETLND